MNNSVRDIVPFYSNPFDQLVVQIQQESLKNFLKNNDEKGFIEYVQKHNIPVSSISLPNMDLIHFCAIKGWVEVAEILHKENPEEINKPLNLSKNKGSAGGLNIDFFIDLDQFGIKRRVNQGNSPIQLALLNKRDEMCHFLLDRNVNLRMKNDYHMTVLMFAAINPNYTMFELILERMDPQDYNAQDFVGNNALHYAVIYGREEPVFTAMIVKGVNPNCVNYFGFTPLLKAADESSESVIQTLLDVTDEAFINIATVDGVTALFCATTRGLEAICRSLIDKNADPGAVVKGGSTALHTAIANNHKQIAELYLDKISDDRINQLTMERISVLQLAVAHNYEELCQILLDRGADYRLVNHLGINALDMGMSKSVSLTAKKISSLEGFFQIDPDLQEFLTVQRALLHRFNVAITTEINTTRVKFETGVASVNYNLIQDSLVSYFEDKASEMQDSTFINILLNIKNAIWPDSLVNEKLLESITNGNIVIISTGWKGENGNPGHEVTVVIFDKYFFLCDRSRGQDSGVSIYEIQDHTKLNADCEIFFSQNEETNQFLSYRINQVSYLKKKWLIPLPSQTVGNCTWASPHAGVLALFTVLFMKLSHPIEVALEMAISEYDQWNDWDREDALYDYFSHSLHQKDQKPLEWGIIPMERVITEIVLSLDMEELPDWINALKSYYGENYDEETDDIPDLCWSVLKEDHEAIEKAVVETKVSTSGTYSPLHFASLIGNESLVRRLTELGWTYNFKDLVAPTPAHLALKNGHAELAKWWISKMSNPNLRDQRGQTLLYLACETNQIEVVRILLDTVGIDISIGDDEMTTPLMVAISKGFEEIAKLIILRSTKKDLMLEDKRGNNAFHYAADNNLKIICSLLLKKHLNPSILNNGGMSPLSIAISRGHVDLAKWLIEKSNFEKEDLDLKDKDGWTALHFAAVGNHLEICQMLLEKEVNPKIVTKNGLTPLILALISDHVELAEWLIRESKLEKEVLDHADGDGWTAFHFAVVGNHLRICQILLERGLNPKTVTKKETTPLMLALEKDHVELAAWLIKKGKFEKEDLDHADKDGWTAFHCAVRRNLSGICYTLLEKGVNPKIATKNGLTPLMLALDKGHVELAAWLVREGKLEKEDLDHADKDGWTAFHCAVRRNLSGICHTLLEKGVNPRIATKNGLTPLMLALDKGHVELAAWLIREGKLEKEDLDQADKDGWTAFHFAAVGNHLEICQMLLERGVNPKAVTKDGKTPLMLALEKDHVKLAEWLIQIGKLEKEDLDKADKDGWTAFHFAAEGNHLEICQMLLEKEVNPKIVTKNGLTPLILALISDHVELAEWLIREGIFEKENLEQADDKGLTAFSIATLKKNARICQLLAERGVNQ